MLRSEKATVVESLSERFRATPHVVLADYKGMTAGQASTTREQVANALNHLYRSGLVRRRGNSLYVTDRPALEELLRS